MALSKKLTQIALVLSAVPAAAFAGEMGTVYTQLSTNGLGLGYAASVSEGFAVRGQINALPKQTFTGDVGDFGAGNTMTVELNWSSAQLVGDWYPTSSGFRLSGGAVFNSSKLTLAGQGKVGTNAGTSTVNAEIKMSEGIAPYAGIGYSTKPKDAKGFGFVFDLGLMFQNPKVTLNATGGGVTAAQIEEQRVKVQDAIDKLKIFPVFGIGLSYSF
jgi:hypothetical protein